MKRGAPFRLQSMPASAMNQTSTDRSTCTTSATWKKSATGSRRLRPGVRESTSRIEKSPEPIRAAMPSHSQPRASSTRASCGTASRYSAPDWAGAGAGTGRGGKGRVGMALMTG